MTIYKIQKRSLDSFVQSLVTGILSETDDGSFSVDKTINPDLIKKMGITSTIKEDDDGGVESPEDWKSACGDILKGGQHSFHGDRMYPCGDSADQYMNIGDGPFLGHGTPSQQNIRDADKYIEEYAPDEIVAYSRGGAVAVRTSNKAKKYKFLAPAWDRDLYGADTDSISDLSGEIYHGAGDRIVPVSHSCRGAKASGMDLYVHPTAGHGKILRHFKADDMGGYKKVPADVLNRCAQTDELPDWGGTGRVDKQSAELDQQKAWFNKNLFTEGDITPDLVNYILKEVDLKIRKKQRG